MTDHCNCVHACQQTAPERTEKCRSTRADLITAYRGDNKCEGPDPVEAMKGWQCTKRAASAWKSDSALRACLLQAIEETRKYRGAMRPMHSKCCGLLRQDHRSTHLSSCGPESSVGRKSGRYGSLGFLSCSAYCSTTVGRAVGDRNSCEKVQPKHCHKQDPWQMCVLHWGQLGACHTLNSTHTRAQAGQRMHTHAHVIAAAGF